jgi:nitric oxide reductase subunit C
LNSLKRIILLITLNLTVAITVFFTASSTNYSTETKEISGIDIWRSKNCAACHSIFGLGGHIGPDLTNTYKYKNEEYLDLVLNNGLQNMPNLNLSKHEREQLILFFKDINNLGVYPLKSITSNPFGEKNDF